MLDLLEGLLTLFCKVFSIYPMASRMIKFVHEFILIVIIVMIVHCWIVCFLEWFLSSMLGA